LREVTKFYIHLEVFMSRHKKINRAKEIDRRRKRRKESLKLRLKEAKTAGK